MEQSLFSKIEAKFDSLTGVYERFAMENFARTLIQENHPFSLLLIDGDNFKNVNDGFGHSVGDLVIKVIANRIKEGVGEDGLVGRFGGDEFMAIIPDIVEYDAIWNKCREIHAEFENFSVPEYPSIFVTITSGLFRFPKDGSTYEELFEKADKALYRGKQKGRSCFIIYLDEKHKDIKIHSSNAPSQNSLQQHTSIFSLMSKSDDLRKSIPLLLQYFTTNLMIEHVCIQGKKDIVFSEVYSLSRGKKFSFIDNSLISLNVNKAMSVFYMNDVRQLSTLHQESLLKKLDEQIIVSTFFAEISYDNTFYGYLRADMTANMRIWQNSDMDLLITAAKAIAMALHYQNKSLEDL
ncbi:MAG: GGDEF domain-containing protein [Treponema sp.]|nr:GGDEF domain-containing protein [Treponema sp.]